ncbi:MAG: hypothetical protein HQM16_15150 [Deltaproteobacteria bacterium]|nr:hypothetical protein [Deltaproteobacteria bacterium]
MADRNDYIKRTRVKKPSLSYSVYLLAILALLIIIVVGLKGTKLDNYCPAKKIPCQVYLNKGEKSPYRNVHAAYSGWHFSGYAEVKACWVGYPAFCDICNDSPDARNAACDMVFPRHQAKATR